MLLMDPKDESSTLSDDDPLCEKAEEHSTLTKDEDSFPDKDATTFRPKLKRLPRKYKKAPGAPKRFRSAFILFSQYKHKAIQEALASEGSSEKTTSVAKMVSEEWRTMDPEERSRWEDKAKMDRERFEKEKAKYCGPWSVPIGHRKSKDPTAPKRSPSAFLSFSNSRRAAVKQANKEASNAEISKILSRMWKEAPDDLKKEYTDKEAIAREEYKKKIAAWRVEHERNKEKAKDPLELYQEKQEERKRKGIPSDEDDDDSLNFSVDGQETKRPRVNSSASFTGSMGSQGIQSNDLTQMMYARNLALSQAQLGHPNLASVIASQQMLQLGMLPTLSPNVFSQQFSLLPSNLVQDYRSIPSLMHQAQINSQSLQSRVDPNFSVASMNGLQRGVASESTLAAATATAQLPPNSQSQAQEEVRPSSYSQRPFASMQPQQQRPILSAEQQREQDFLKKLLAARKKRPSQLS